MRALFVVAAAAAIGCGTHGKAADAGRDVAPNGVVDAAVSSDAGSHPSGTDAAAESATVPHNEASAPIDATRGDAGSAGPADSATDSPAPFDSANPDASGDASVDAPAPVYDGNACHVSCLGSEENVFTGTQCVIGASCAIGECDAGTCVYQPGILSCGPSHPCTVLNAPCTTIIYDAEVMTGGICTWYPNYGDAGPP